MSSWFWQIFSVTPVILVGSLLVNNNSIATETSAIQTATKQTEVLPTREKSLELADSSFPQSVSNSDTETILDRNTLLEQIEGYQNINSVNEGLENDSIEQVTDVHKLQDVSPGDWAYEALRSLVERYGCIEGYPDQTFQGKRALTRWEFAASLQVCIEKIERLAAESRSIQGQDLEKLQRLRQEYVVELTTLKERLNNLEERSAFLEDVQFSPTTKFSSQLFTYFSGAWRGDDLLAEGESVFSTFNPPRDGNNRPRRRVVDSNPNPTYSYYTFLNFDTSFYGKDNLSLKLAVGNGFAPANLLLSAGFLNSSGTPNALQTGTPNANRPVVYEFSYQFPAGIDNLQIVVGPRINVYNYFDTNRFTFFINGPESFNSSGSTQFSPIDRGAGAVLIWDINEIVRLNAGYLGNSTEFLPPSRGQSAADPKRGLFGGTYNIMAELDITPIDDLNLRFIYTRSRLEPAQNGFIGGAIGEPIPYGFADDGFGGPLRFAFANLFLFNFDWLVTEGFGVFGRYSYGNTNLTPKDSKRGKGTINSQSLQLGFSLPDLGKEGAQANFSYLIPFSILDGREFLVSGGGDGGIQYEFEVNYYYPFTDKIAMVPSFYVILNPNNFDSNAPIYVGNYRLQFNF